MRLSTGMSPRLALLILGLGCPGRLLAQDPIPESRATPQSPQYPPLPGSMGMGTDGAGSLGGVGGSASGSGGYDSSAFGPNGNAGSAFGAGGAGTDGGAGGGAAAGASAATAGGGASPGTGGFAGTSGAAPGVIGDFGPLIAHPAATAGVPQPPPIPPPTKPSSPNLPGVSYRSKLAPSVRGFKIADNQSPFPQDRVFYTFNFFNDVNAKINRYFYSPIDQINVYREIFGFEKTFNDGKGSIGLRLPLNTIHADTSPGLVNQGGQSTAVGNLTIFAKYILEYNPRTGNVLTAGLAITPPTGPGRFAGASFLGGVGNNTTIQPFLGYFVNLTPSHKLFLQGFEAIDVPVNYQDVTLFYSDLALGYYAYQNPDSLISAVVPTVECHVNAPLNHRAEYSFRDPAGTATSVNITSGLNLEIRRNSLFTIGVVAPTTGPRPFNVEAVALFNYRFGASRRPRPTPVIGG